MFTATQRWRPIRRICIGLEGHIRLCKHKVIKWGDLAPAARQLGAVGAKLQSTIKLFRYMLTLVRVVVRDVYQFDTSVA